MQLHLKIETNLRLIAKKTEKRNIFHNINKSTSISGGSDFLGHKKIQNFIFFVSHGFSANLTVN